MGLRDHFRPPLHPLHHWDSFHSNWATRIADALNDRHLPAGYVAEEHTHLAGGAEIDVAAFRAPDAVDSPSGWSPGPPTAVAPFALPDTFEVRVLTEQGGATLVGVIELVSPGNKDRPEQRRAFVAKCAGLLHQGASVVIVDVVTTRGANLHDELAAMVGAPSARMAGAPQTYASAWRPLVRAGEPSLEVWSATCELGASLPTLPLRLVGDLVVPVELQVTYEEACRRRRIPLE
jgi:hypothetical protein